MTTTAEQQASADVTALKNDISTLETAKADLLAKSKDLFIAEINNIDEKIASKTAELESKTKATVNTAVNNATTVVKETEAETTSWWVKYHYDVYVIAGLLMLGYYIFVK